MLAGLMGLIVCRTERLWDSVTSLYAQLLGCYALIIAMFQWLDKFLILFSYHKRDLDLGHLVVAIGSLNVQDGIIVN